MSRWIALAALLFACAATAQPDAVVLVARPQLADPNFAGAVVLITHSASGDTVGVVLNRPSERRFADMAPEFPGAVRYQGRLYEGGPVLERIIVALFRAEAPPAGAAFRVLPDIYLSMHPGNINTLLENPRPKLRFFAGFSGWAPGQLEAEIAREDWYVLPATEELLFRADTSRLWRDLIDRARRRRAIYFPE